MAGFYIYETYAPTIVLRPEGVLDDAKQIIVSFHQMNGPDIEKTGQDVAIDTENTEINLFLSQEETGQFNIGECDVQVNILYEDSARNASCQGTIRVFDNLHREVMA